MNKESGIHSVIHESRLPLLHSKFKNLNRRLHGQGKIGYSIVGTQVGPYIDENGDRHDDGLYFQVVAEGSMKFANMEYVGKIDITNGRRNTIRPYGQISQSEYDAMMNLHGNECTCCNTSRKRNELYAFRCTSTFTNPETGMTYEEGNIYPVGSNCIDKFTGVHAREIVEQLSGEIDLSTPESIPKNVRPVHVDADKFMAYALTVSKLRLDEAMSFYKAHRSWREAPVDSAVAQTTYNVALANPKTYRKMTGTTQDEMVGNITRTALATYHMCENGYVDMKFFGDENKLRMFKAFMELTDFTSEVAAMSKSAKQIHEAYIDSVEQDDMFIRIQSNNVNALTSSGYIHNSHAQKLVDICDVYFLQRNSVAMHEEKAAPYSVDEYGGASGMIAVGKDKHGATKFGKVKIPNYYGSHYCGKELNNQDLTRLFYGYPIILRDCHTRNGSFDTVVSIQQNISGKCTLMKDDRFLQDGKINEAAVKRYRPPFLPENTRIVTTSFKPDITVETNTTKLQPDMRTGEVGNRYVKEKNSPLKHDIIKQGFEYHNGSNLVQGAGQFEVDCGTIENAQRLQNMGQDIAVFMGDMYGLEDDVSRPLTVMVSNGDTKKCTVTFMNFPEDVKLSAQIQESMVQYIEDDFRNDKVTIGKIKPVTDEELVAVIKSHAEKPSIIDARKSLGKQTLDTSLDAVDSEINKEKVASL